MNFIRSDRSEKMKNAEGTNIADYFKGMVSCSSCSVDFYWSCLVKNPRTGKLEHNMSKALSEKIRLYGRNRPVVGCVAWLSGKDYLDPLLNTLGLSIVVNREKYDVWGHGCVKKIYPILPRFQKPMHEVFKHLGGPLTAVETHKKFGKSSIHPIRAFGTNTTFSGPGKRRRRYTNSNEDVTLGTGGLEHCKYLIFFEAGEEVVKDCKKRGATEDCDYLTKEFVSKESWNPKALYPYRVWTGSMNMTGKSKEHHENSMWCTGFKAAMGFYHDFSWTFINTTSVFSKSKTATPTVNNERKRASKEGKM